MDQYYEFFWTQSTTACKIQPTTPSKKHVVATDKAGVLLQGARIVVVTHRSANEKESAGRLGSPVLPDLLF